MELSTNKLEAIKQSIRQLAGSYGFQDARVSDTSTSGYFEKFQSWIEKNYHGEMIFLERNQNLRQFPEKLHPGTTSIISLRYNYLPQDASFCTPLKNADLANISRYALGRDYHKIIRKKLSKLCASLANQFRSDPQINCRVFVDSAPVMETSFAEKSGLGWKGKHTLIINENAGSWFFLGEIFINLPLSPDPPVNNQCGNCTACIKLCPTEAITGPNTIDARRCISYLTIENKQAIPIELRPKIGNRIYGCDDCQLACPWNRFSQTTRDTDFQPKLGLHNASLMTLWQWNEEDFLTKLQGSPIRRIGYQRWLRNIAIAIGNSEFCSDKITALKQKKPQANNMVKEHIDWAIATLQARASGQQALLNKRATTKTAKLINCVQQMLPRDA